MIIVVSDLHGNFKVIEELCDKVHTTKKDILIDLGDLMINYYTQRDKQGKMVGEKDYDAESKAYLESLPITIFSVRGNHENRPEKVEGYKLCQWHGGLVYVQEEYPSIKIAKTGEIYDFNGYKTMAICGAASPDKNSRIRDGRFYCMEEQVSVEEEHFVEKQLKAHDWKIDVMLSHTAPIKYQPREAFLPGMKQYMIDIFMEKWLDHIEDKLEYKYWFAGHYHIDKDMDKMHFVYNRCLEFPMKEVER